MCTSSKGFVNTHVDDVESHVNNEGLLNNAIYDMAEHWVHAKRQKKPEELIERGELKLTK